MVSGPATSASVCLCAGAAAPDCLVRLHGSGPASSASVPAPVPVPAHPLRGQGQHGGRCPCGTNPGKNKILNCHNPNMAGAALVAQTLVNTCSNCYNPNMAGACPVAQALVSKCPNCPNPNMAGAAPVAQTLLRTKPKP